jgi:flavin reductase (DIM6/NTAB) family NADH-FMN oxidoreductase RutF
VPYLKTVTQSDIAAVLGRIPSGIFILTVRHNGLETGMLSSWVMQAGFEPPMVTVAVNRSRYIGEWLDAGAPFVLNVVAEGQKSLLKHFGHGFEPGWPAFEGIEIVRSPRDVPVLTESLGYLECTPVTHVDSSDHRIYLARVEHGALLHDQPPMTHVRKSGLHY